MSPFPTQYTPAELGAKIREGLANNALSRIILFGSRANGTHNLNSDYDIMLVTQRTFTHEERRQFMQKARRYFVWELNICVDLILKSESQVEEEKGYLSFIVGEALKTGIEI